MKLKVCGMRYPENIRQLIREVDPGFVGFIFHPGSPRYFLDGPEEIPDELDRTKRTGVFVNSTYDEITGLAGMFGLQNIQLHGQETPELCLQLKNAGFTVIRAFQIPAANGLKILNNYAHACDYFLFDTNTSKHGGSGKKFNWKLLDESGIPKPWFLAGGIDAGDVSAIRKLKNKPFAIDINSRFEIGPGLKDIKKIAAFKNELFNYANTQNHG